MQQVNIFWFRRDLRITDNHGLYIALLQKGSVQAVFIFDTNLLESIEDKKDRRLHFIKEALDDVQSKFMKCGTTLDVRVGRPKAVFQQLIKDYSIEAVYANEDYEPYALQRDQSIKDLLQQENITFHTVKDHVIFSKNNILKPEGKPYTVFTPYYKTWLANITTRSYQSFPSENKLHQLVKRKPIPIPSLRDIGFMPVPGYKPIRVIPLKIIREYDKNRDIPGIRGTSRLGVHLRFGTLSIRKIAALAAKTNPIFLKELIWREFYQMILFHFPETTHQCFKKEFDCIEWINNETDFQKWKEGNTGYPLVDAGMRELNATGFMHNRIRMITASFLCKHLLIDWRWGEAYFAQKLSDYDGAANIGGWQWCAGTGNDAAPYFRIFNPALQQQKFDPILFTSKNGYRNMEHKNIPYRL